MKTAVITTGGLGTRLLTSTKGTPKTMLPLFDKSHDKSNDPLVRPLLEMIFENLYDAGFRKFCFIIGGKTKHSILNHMKPDANFIKLLEKRNTSTDKRFKFNIQRIYKKIKQSKIAYISQATPMGFGHALTSASKFVGNDTFLLHAGDAYFPDYDFLPKFINQFNKNQNLEGSLLLKKTNNLKGYGIAQINKVGNSNLIFNVQEKPKKPLSNLAILPVYVFTSKIFEALKNTKKGYNGELQVTDAIKTMLDDNKSISGYIYPHKVWYDIGTAQNYFKAIKTSYSKSTNL